MKVLLFTQLLVVISYMNLYGQNKCSLDYIRGRWVEQQAEYMHIEWHFHDENNFTLISYYGGELSTFLRGDVFSSKYRLDTINEVITEAQYKMMNLSTGSIFTIDSTKSVTKWKLLSCNNEELRLMEIGVYEIAIKYGSIDYAKWGTRLLIRPKNLIYTPKKN